MSVELYCAPLGFPTRAVLLLARALDISLDIKIMNLLEGEHLAEDFVKMNPQHSVPFLVDGDVNLSESSAIMIYLTEVYGKDDSLYPQDLKQRAVINQRLFFNNGHLAIRLINTYLIPVIWKGEPVNEENLPKLDDSFNILNTFLEGKDWVAGDQITVADYALVATVSTAEVIGYDVNKYENVSAWLSRCKETIEDYDDLNQSNADKLATFYAEKLSQIES